jgi:ketosteroid isomerase-like protein
VRCDRAALSSEDFRDWLDSYGAAWEGRDPEAAATLFTEDARYYWTPFDEPKRGKEGIAAAWREATSRQRNVRFSYDLLSVSGAAGVARWHATFERRSAAQSVELDGILLAEFADDARCRVFREWWHSTEV